MPRMRNGCPEVTVSRCERMVMHACLSLKGPNRRCDDDHAPTRGNSQRFRRHADCTDPAARPRSPELF